MLDTVLKNFDLTDFDLTKDIQIGLVVGLTAIVTIIVSRLLPPLIGRLWRQFSTTEVEKIYQTIIEPCKGWIQWAFVLSGGETLALIIPVSPWQSIAEIVISLSLAIVVCLLFFRLFRQFFDNYLLDLVLKRGQKVNSEFLILARFFANFAVIVLSIIIFAQTHQINVVGLIASLGIGGLAIAFAAQKTLEQFLGGIVLYIDRPFVVDDYIGLPDGTFGQVESIGLRSTKVRTSGKGTLVIVPNSSLTQVTIENFTGVKKVMSIINLTFYRVIPYEEQALIRQVILDSTSDIFGLDSQSTDIGFKELSQNSKTQVQITFFILGSGDVSMELRRQLLDIASQNITDRLKDYGIEFEIEDPTIYVDSPITI